MGKGPLVASKGGKTEKQNTAGDRKSGKAVKKHPKVFDPIKRRLVTKS